MTADTSSPLSLAEFTNKDARALEQLAVGGRTSSISVKPRVQQLLLALADGIATGKRVVLVEEGGHFTVEQVAQVLQISIPHLQLLIRAGQIATVDRDGIEVVSTLNVLQAVEAGRVMQRLIDTGQELERH